MEARLFSPPGLRKVNNMKGKSDIQRTLLRHPIMLNW